MVASVTPLPPPGPAGPSLRLESLDGIRLLAAFGVLLYHYNGEFGIGLEPVIPGLHRVYLLVDLFFVLSGFVLAETYGGRIVSPSSYGTYLARRVGRIYPLHLLTLLATLALGHALVGLGLWPGMPAHMQPSGLPANLLLLQAWGVTADLSFNYPSWSVSAELLQYMLFPAYLALALRLPSWASAGAFAAAVLAIATLHLGGGPWSGFTVDGALRAAPSFFAGAAISVAVRRARRLPSVPWAAVYAYGTFLLLCLGSGLHDAWLILLDPVLILLVVLAERRGARTWLRSRPMVLLGQASYSIYMLHIPISVAVMGLGRPLVGTGLPASVLLCLTALALTLWLSLVSFRRFERPAQRFVSRSYDHLRGARPAAGLAT
jgi:peptidoglycan/LPS O-acetylase OafA/YrhL